jgi:SAM-dependent methyltransferase
MKALDWLHTEFVYDRRVLQLTRHLSELVPRGATVLDVGCGDGRIDRLLLEQRPDLSIEGIDVLVRQDTSIPVRPFDGATIPLPSGSVDVVTFVDVLHHTADPLVLLREARRVSRRAIVIKDHLNDGPLAPALLRIMDWVGNARHGVALPYNYWSSAQWADAFAQLSLTVELQERDLRLYPPVLDQIFGAGLHFVARLVHGKAAAGSGS